MNYHPITISKLWNASVPAAAGVAGEERVHSLRFEDLLAGPDGTVGEVCDFVGVLSRRACSRSPQVEASSGQDNPGKARVDPGRELAA